MLGEEVKKIVSTTFFAVASSISKFLAVIGAAAAWQYLHLWLHLRVVTIM
ncbi:MAG: hypothetical protein LBQ24_02155 [Candidatus Peribacteria bacterium]|nr:hypothetical protein [Candidatus Peribacteria bacterium]